MTEPAPAVALLFDDAGLVAHLREALQERGVRIVHEGPPAGAGRELLRGCGAEVVVVNLEEDGDEGLDELYEALDGDGLRVVFNDAAASRGLDGWDRARWARHLAVKVLAAGELEPPRPSGAPVVETRPAPAPLPPPRAVPAFAPAAESETLAAELEALLAAEAPVESPGPSTIEEPALAALHEGVTGLEPVAESGGADAAASAGHEPAGLDEKASWLASPVPAQTPPAEAGAPALAVLHEGAFELEPAGQGDRLAAAPGGEHRAPVPAALAGLGEGLSLAPLDDAPLAAAQIRRETVGAPSWSLLGEGEEPATPASFGIDKLSAAEYLAPPAPAAADDATPLGLNLELVSMEEALAPQAHEAPREMLLGEPEAAIRRLLVLGASGDTLAAVRDFLAALPAGLPPPVLLAADWRGQPAAEVAAELAAASGRPVAVAGPGARLRPGEVLVVPEAVLARPSRDSRLDLRGLDGDAALAPVDAAFAAAAEVFGRDLLAVLFTGLAGDGLVGAQAVRARGGRVWAEVVDGAEDMAADVVAAGLANFSGAPSRLAARLGDDDAWRDGE